MKHTDEKPLLYVPRCKRCIKSFQDITPFCGNARLWIYDTYIYVEVYRYWIWYVWYAIVHLTLSIPALIWYGISGWWDWMKKRPEKLEKTYNSDEFMVNHIKTYYKKQIERSKNEQDTKA